nr:M24 family metallopeptidase [Maliibacterium massiliense]
MTIREDFQRKVALVRDLMAQKGVSSIAINTQPNFSWLSCGGRGYVGFASEGACASLVVTPDKVYLLSNNIEVNRLLEEELADIADALTPAVFLWFNNPRERNEQLAKFAGSNPKNDTDFPVEFRRMRTALSEIEVARARAFGQEMAVEMENVMKSIKPGMMEEDIVGKITEATFHHNIQPVGILCGVDERVFARRHPVAGPKKLEKYCLFAFCFRKYGIVQSMTRMVHFGPVDAELQAKLEACAAVDAAYVRNTIVGKTWMDAFKAGQAEYAAQGWPDEWKNHHQGGLAGYNSRELIVLEDNAEPVLNNSLAAWNPTIQGTKMEDTFLISENGQENLTHTGNWTYVTAGGMQRPGILVL